MRTSSLSMAIAAGLVIFSPNFANATDLGRGEQYTPADAYVSTKAPSWTGFWVGINGGGVFGYSDVEHRQYQNQAAFDAGIVGGYGSIDGLGTQGLIGEAQIGFDHQFSRRGVVGVFGGVNISDTEFSASFADHGGSDDVDLGVGFDTDWGAVAGLRLGFLKSPSTMFYIAGGYAYTQIGDVSVTFDDSSDTLAGPELDGWFGEVGMETRIPEISDNVFLTVMGRYTDYGSESYTVTANDNVHTVEVDADSLAVMVGLKAKLGGL